MHDVANDARPFGLSRKQRLAVALAADGLANEEIAKLVGTSVHVVKNYLRAVYDRLGMWSRLELALWYVKRRHDGDISDWHQ